MIKMMIIIIRAGHITYAYIKCIHTNYRRHIYACTHTHTYTHTHPYGPMRK